MKWSDGAPFTADDFIFWFEDIYGNPEIVPTPTPEMRPQGKPGRMVKVDETTVRCEFDVPYYLFEDIMAGDTADRRRPGGAAGRQGQLRRLCAGALPQAVPAEILVASRR